MSTNLKVLLWLCAMLTIAANYMIWKTYTFSPLLNDIIQVRIQVEVLFTLT